MQHLNNKNTLLTLMTQGATLITPNNRLSNALLRTLFAYCHGKTILKSACLPYHSAISAAYQRLLAQRPDLNHPVLLNKTQLEHLWRYTVQKKSTVTYSEGLLKALIEAWQYCELWQVPEDEVLFQYTPQTRQFQLWRQTVNQRLKQDHLLCEEQLVPYLIRSNQPLFGKQMVWVCFDDFTPQQTKLQNHLAQQGVEQYRYDLSNQNQKTSLFAAADKQEEFDQMIAWLQARLAQGQDRIGLVIPNLQDQSRYLERLLSRHFHSSVFDISLGKTLDSFPLVAHAMAWIHLDTASLNAHQAALLLQSPYLAAAQQEFEARSQYLQDSKILLSPTISLANLIQDLSNKAPKLAQALQQLDNYPAKASISDWIDCFQKRLNRIGFPGDYGLDSINYQCFGRFGAIFDEFRQLAIISDELSQKEALEALDYLLKSTIFQPQKAPAPIQISGLLEASGCEFDSLWIMGLNDQCLPQKSRLSAFIPPQLQRELLMPHCLPERELQFARQTLDRLQQGSMELVTSYAKLEADKPQLPCSLLSNYPPYQAVSLPKAQNRESRLVFEDESYQIPMTASEKISGGTRLLANQAKCPFKAFAEHRLQAKALPETEDGISALEKGQLIHKVMELLWSELKNQRQLLQTDAETLDQHIDTAIKNALLPLKMLQPRHFPKLIEDVEYLRLKRIVEASLDWERQRPAFEVLALEQEYAIQLGGLDFKVRIDRLDKVANSKWVIDYKSNLPGSKPWNEDRPKEPQLLLYALLDEQITTLLLLQLKSAGIECCGISDDDQGLSGIGSTANWKDERANWQTQLNQLATEFRLGHCPPQPINESLCQLCEFQNLCRFRQANA